MNDTNNPTWVQLEPPAQPNWRDPETERNLFSGLIALQSDLIDRQQFVDACLLWTSQKGSSMADVLVRQGWLRDDDCSHIDYLLQRRVDKQGGDVGQSIATLPDEYKALLDSIGNGTIHPTVRIAQDDQPESQSARRSVPRVGEQVTLTRLHSTGGIGQVWIAFDEILGREIALKELKADHANVPRSRERFFREAQLTGQLEHPGIVPVYSYASDEHSGRFYYTMRFVRGRTLTQAIRDYHRQRMETDGLAVSTELIRLLNAFISICQTIAYAHSRNVLHRDLKGDNVILGGFGEVIVLDWGLAKRLDAPELESANSLEGASAADSYGDDPGLISATMQGEKLGTPAYMAPEQATGQIDEIDRRTDIYGLAAILYEILAGEPPFLGKSIVEILHRVIHDPPKPPTEIVSTVPAELEAVCLRGLAKRREDRQQSALELAEHIQHWLAERAERKRTEQERERFFSLSLDLLAILDSDGGLTQTNPAWERLLGWTSAELHERRVWDILHPDECHLLSRDLERILAGDSLTAIEHRCRCKSGEYRWVLWNASLIDGEGAVYLVGRDITERKQSEQTFQELLESAPDGMVVINQSGQIVLVNAQLERLFGFTRQELLGQPIELLVPVEHRHNHPEYVARFMADPTFRPMASNLKLAGRRRDGMVFPAEISLSPVRTEQGLLVSAAVRDLSRRQTEVQQA